MSEFLIAAKVMTAAGIVLVLKLVLHSVMPSKRAFVFQLIVQTTLTTVVNVNAKLLDSVGAHCLSLA